MDSDEFIRHIQQIDVEAEAQKVLKQHTKNAADLNRDQLKKGFDANGERLKPYKNARYASYKNTKNPLPGLGNPDLILSGSFTKSIYSEVTDTDIVLKATDRKTADLVDKYSDSILDISQESVSTFTDIIRSTFENEIQKYFQ